MEKRGKGEEIDLMGRKGKMAMGNVTTAKMHDVWLTKRPFTSLLILLASQNYLTSYSLDMLL